MEIGGTILEDCESRELFFKGVGERKDLLALPTGRLGPREDWNLRGVTAGVCWNLRSVTVGGCWTMREMGLSVQAKSEQGGGVTITNCCAWNKKKYFTFHTPRGEYFIGQIFTPAHYTLPWPGSQFPGVTGEEVAGFSGVEVCKVAADSQSVTCLKSLNV